MIARLPKSDTSERQLGILVGMAWFVEVDQQARLVILTAPGALTGQEFLSLNEHVRASPGFDRTFDFLADFRATGSGPLTSEAIATAARQSPLFSRSSALAVVVETDAGYGIARMFNLYVEADAFEIFRTVEDARTWLTAGRQRTSEES